LVPEPLALWAVQGTNANLLALYLALRTTDGHTTPNPKALAKDLECSPRTITNRLKVINSLGWINKTAQGTYMVISLDRLTALVTGQSPTRAFMPADDLPMLKKCLLASLIDRWNSYGRLLLACPPLRGGLSPHVGGLASSVIAGKVGLTQAWAKKWVAILCGCGLLTKERRQLEVDITQHQLDTERSSANASVRGMRKAWGKVYESLANILTPCQSLAYQWI
jgi:DNA-binding MarR family transcriptional regulator